MLLKSNQSFSDYTNIPHDRLKAKRYWIGIIRPARGDLFIPVRPRKHVNIQFLRIKTFLTIVFLSSFNFFDNRVDFTAADFYRNCLMIHACINIIYSSKVWMYRDYWMNWQPFPDNFTKLLT